MAKIRSLPKKTREATPMLPRQQSLTRAGYDSVQDALTRGDEDALVNQLNFLTINTTGSYEDEFLLVKATRLGHINVVRFLLNHPEINLTRGLQGANAIVTALNEYMQSSSKSKRTQLQNIVLLLLSHAIFFNPAQKRQIDLVQSGLLTDIIPVNPLMRLIHTLCEYQAVSSEYGYTSALMAEMVWQNKLAIQFKKLGDDHTAKKWYMLAINSALDAVGSESDVFAQGEEAGKIFIELLKATVGQYNPSKRILGQFDVTAEQALSAAMALGTIALQHPENNERAPLYFHVAKAILNTIGGSGNNSAKKFVTAYLPHHPIKTTDVTIARTKRLAKKIDYLVGLEAANIAGSLPARIQLEREAQTHTVDTASKLISRHLFGMETKNITLDALKDMYGLNKPVDTGQALIKFEKIAYGHENLDPMESFNAYLYSAMAQYRILIEEKSTIAIAIERAMKTYLSMLPLYSEKLTLAYQIEIFALLFDFLNAATTKYSKGRVLEVIFLYQRALTQFPLDLDKNKLNTQSRQELLGLIYKEMHQSGLFKDFAWTIVIQGLIEIVESANDKDVQNIIFQQLNDLCEKSKKHELAEQMYSEIKKALVKYYTANIASCDINEINHCIDLVQEMKADLGGSNRKFDMRKYAYLYKEQGDKLQEPNEKIKAYQAAIELGNTSSAFALIEMLPLAKMDAMIKALDSVIKNALYPENIEVILAIHACLKKRNDNFSPAKIDEMDKYIVFERNVNKAHDFIVHHDTDEKLVKLFCKENYLPAMKRLYLLHKELGHVRRSLFLAARLCAELIFNAENAKNRYDCTEEKNIEIRTDALKFMGEIANSKNEYSGLAKWYINFVTAVQLMEVRALVPVAIYKMMLGTCHDLSVDQYENVKIGMSQALNLNKEYLNKLTNSFVKDKSPLKSSILSKITALKNMPSKAPKRVIYPVVTTHTEQKVSEDNSAAALNKVTTTLFHYNGQVPNNQVSLASDTPTLTVI